MAEDLKSIFIIGGSDPLWAEVKKFLTKINTTLFTLNHDTDLAMLESLDPSLLIMNSETYLTMPPIADSFMKLIIKEEGSSMPLLREGSGKGAVMVDWPQEERAFLELTSRLLTVSPRRSFKALIRILPKGDTVTYMGESENFSLTGIGFRTNHTLQQGDEVEISFYVPANRKTANFGAEVVRCLPCHVDDATRYGARYVNLAPDTEEVMNKFIRSI
jgi:hypothetical protein